MVLEDLGRGGGATLHPVDDDLKLLKWSDAATGGKGFVAYAAFKDHYSFFPMSGLAVESHKKELGERVTGKGTIQFRYDERFPVGLVKKVVKTRLAEAEARRTR